MEKKRYSFVLSVLCFVSMTLCVVSNIIGSTVFSLKLAFISTGGILFPLIYAISDVVSEVYGYRISRWNAWLSLLSSLFVTYSVLFFTQVIPHPDFNTSLVTACYSVFSSSGFVVIASIIATVLGSWVNDILFQRFKHKDGNNKFAKRKFISSAVGELVDTVVFASIAFGLSGQMGWNDIFKMILVYYPFKYLIEVVTEPLAYKLAVKIREVEGEDVYEDNKNLTLFGFAKKEKKSA